MAESPIAGYQVGSVGFFSLPESHDVQLEPRGILWCWELPRRDCSYVVGCDPTHGVTGWSLQNSVHSDRKIDNAALQVVRVGKVKSVTENKVTRYVREPDVQVAEYAAPIDPIACAHVINAVGKLYRGDAEDEGCLVNLEVYPGPGIATLPELYGKLGYSNIYQQQYLNSTTPKRNQTYGFYSDVRSKQLLWMKSTRHLKLNGLKINSPLLLEELVDATADKFYASRRPTSQPTHDDRVTALFLAIWALHAWDMDASDAEATHLQPVGTVMPEHQNALVSSSEAARQDAERWNQMLDQ